MYATMEEQKVNFNQTQTVRKKSFCHIKKEVVAVFTDVKVTDFDNEHKLNSNYYCHVKSMSYVHF